MPSLGATILLSIAKCCVGVDCYLNEFGRPFTIQWN